MLSGYGKQSRLKLKLSVYPFGGSPQLVGYTPWTLPQLPLLSPSITL